MFRNYKVAFLSGGTGTFDYPDVGQGAMRSEEDRQGSAVHLAFTTAHVMTVDEFKALVVSSSGSQLWAA